MTKKIAVVNFFRDSEQKIVETRGYHFFTLLTDLEKGDIVAVRTVNGLRFASFDKYLNVSNYAKSFIIAKIDENAIEETVAKEQQARDIKQQLEDRMQEVKRMQEYKAAANTDDTMKALLAELENLD